VKRRFELVPTTDLLLIDDSYNANPDSMLAGLRSLQTAFGKYAKILVLGDMLELGTDSVREHKTVGEYCAKLDPTLLVGVGQQAQYLVEGACQAGLPPSRCRHFADVEAVLEQWPELQNRGDLLYLKASNSLNFQKIVDHIRSHERI
jgi:UDP-N-acetylmuramoyl-tripeptide--D-alanyl-D-alanine ligase